ncbi:Methanogenesis regulatory histidine kinase FilI [uncultured archaeon]|nr:Methanogenesis regulatory histidine kinase FilI [uncultured archaeon]
MVETKILVVEDEVIVADDIQKSLNNLGYTVPATASSGETAIKKAGEYIPDLVLMDIVLQGELDGIETAKQIRSRYDIPVVYLTAFSDKKTLERAKITEPFGYIIKPFRERELKIAIEIALLKHNMERRLKETKERFTTTLKSISDAVIATDSKGCMKFMNPAAQALTGWELKAAEGKHLEEIFNIMIEELVAVQGSPGFEYRTILISRNGTKIPIEGSRAPIKDDKGNITGTVIVFRDITRRKKAEEALRHQGEHFRLLIENISDVITILKEDGTISYQSPSIEHVTGYKPEELIGRNAFELIYPEDLQHVLGAFNEGIRNPESTKSVEYRFRHKNGSWIFFESIGKSLLDNNEPGRVIVNSRDITDRKRAEEAFRESEEQIRLLLNSTAEAIYGIDLNGNCTFCNPACLHILGYERPNALISKNMHALIHHSRPDGRPYDVKECHIFQAFRKGKGVHIENEVLWRKDGSSFPAEYWSYPIRRNNAVVGAVITFFDITERRQAEEKVYETSRYARGLIEASLDPLVTISKEGIITDVNHATELVTGTKREMLIGSDFLDYFTEPEKAKKGYKEAFENGFVRDYPLAIRHSSGKVTDVLYNAAVYKDAAGNVAGVFAAARDITDRKRAEEALHRSEEKYRTMIENSNDMIWTLDKQGNFVYYNKRAEEVSGYDLSERIGKSFAPIIVPEDLSRINEIFLDTISGKPQQYEVNIYKKDRSILTLSVNTAPIFESGEVVGTVSFGRDITEQKKTEEIRIEKERLAGISRAKSEFLANMSHELRTPLNAIIGFSELLKNKVAGELTEKQGHYVENVIISSRHLLSLINDILDLSKIEAGKIELQIENIPIPAIIDVSTTLINEKAIKHNITLKKELDPGLDYIEADPQRFKQILFNLLSNAVKFSKDSGIVTITAKKEGVMAKFQVRDTGIGIKEENLGKLFKAFEQLESGISKAYEGTGLGLSITKKLVELHGGTITAESKYGEGSTFTFLIPIVQKSGKSESYGKT